MFFTLDRVRLQKMIDIVRDTGPRGRRRAPAAEPYLRIEAKDGRVRLSGLRAEAEFAAAVHEPGVLFIRAASLRKLLPTFREQKTLAFQATKDEFIFGDVHMSFARANILLYTDPNFAPEHHPGDRLEAAEDHTRAIADAKRRVEMLREDLAAAEARLTELVSRSPNVRRTFSDTAKPTTRRSKAT